ncbi:MAG: hypothetical protein PHH77_00595 [Victivallaceae bacterium]|nr:hypothetical protein [Victivallaceae bacterium]
MINITSVNEYLALHLQADFWSSLDDNKKNAAFKMAVDDVCGCLGITEIDPARIFQICAVGEQAVFLAEHYDSFNSARQITSEKIDGVGTREYNYRPLSAFSPRALAFLEREAGVLNISRG